jgi:O-antigen biosynthesis protein
MTHSNKGLHVYLREIRQGERSSLSVLASFVSDGSRVLDLGTGSGAIGQYLHEQKNCTVDGVTINEAEAAVARAHYRRLDVADLDTSDLPGLFVGESYDFIICADVLEHLKDPGRVMEACKRLLAPGGKLLLSIPNASYCGLVAELLLGDFRYREEGLLDKTHLRFFTRRSLVRFVGEQGWSMEAMEPVSRDLTESEFKVAFDSLPPSVARYLLAPPDSLTYQFVAVARPHATVVVPAVASQDPEDAHALFTAQLYLGDAQGFSEDNKLTSTGVIGKARQSLTFALPTNVAAPTRLRLDLADRPGFVHLHRITLHAADARVLWQWRSETDGIAMLEAARHHQMALRSPWAMSSSALVLLTGEDPWIELPIPEFDATQCAEHPPCELTVEMGWPMSADYLAMANAVYPLQRKIGDLHTEIGQLNEHVAQAQAQARTDRHATQQALQEVERLTHSRGELQVQAIALTEKNKSMLHEKNLVNRHNLALQTDLRGLNERYAALAQHLRWIEDSTVFRMTRPLIHAKMAVERMLGRRAPESPIPAPREVPAQPISDMVDVIVPVYKGLADTVRCIQAVLASNCRTPWRLVIINDASPEPEVTAWLREISGKDPRILLLENEQNLGFVGTVNRGMALADGHDALLLNSDTEVANDWLDRLRKAAYRDARVGSVTPFSNNATICSYPRFCEDNALPPHYDTPRLDALFAATNPGEVVDVPTGVGFCMYIRRDCLNAVGLFDVEQFGKGYGEENDFCRRASDAGWRNLHALDVFVLHTGGVSFGSSKSQREIEAVEKLRRLHPSYDGLVHTFVNTDPAREARQAVDLARVHAAALPCVLAVTHNRGGGTHRHVLELAKHFSGRATFFILLPTGGGTVQLQLAEPGAGFQLEFALPQESPALLQALQAIGVAHIHYHHTLGHFEEVLHLPERLGVAWDFTAHDFYALCPQISLTDRNDKYCGEDGSGSCGRCLEYAPLPGVSDIDQWRQKYGEFLVNARHVLSPSLDAARRFRRMWPHADIRLAPHTDIASHTGLPPPSPVQIEARAPLKIVVIGALSKIKGADVLDEVARLAKSSGAAVELHLLGHAYRDLARQPRSALTVYGPYEEAELPGLLEWLQPHVVWFPALWPETYSYTLSSALQAGLPVVAPDLGAFAERLNGRKWSWVMPWDTAPAQWLAFFVKIRDEHFATGISPRPYWSVAQEQDGAIKPWSYDAQYLVDLPQGAPTPALDRAFLLAQRVGRVSGQQGQRVKNWALSGLVWLRAAPPLRAVAKAIPRRWQTRIKSWLKG